MARPEDKVAFVAPLAAGQGQATQVLTLTKITGVNITPVEVAPGYYQFRCPEGTSADTITMLLRTSTAVVADTALTLPAAGAAEVPGLLAAPGDGYLPLYVSNEARFLACAWDGAATSTLILTRVMQG